MFRYHILSLLFASFVISEWLSPNSVGSTCVGLLCDSTSASQHGGAIELLHTRSDSSSTPLPIYHILQVLKNKAVAQGSYECVTTVTQEAKVELVVSSLGSLRWEPIKSSQTFQSINREAGVTHQSAGAAGSMVCMPGILPGQARFVGSHLDGQQHQCNCLHKPYRRHQILEASGSSIQFWEWARQRGITLRARHVIAGVAVNPVSPISFITYIIH